MTDTQAGISGQDDSLGSRLVPPDARSRRAVSFYPPMIKVVLLLICARA